MATDEKRGGPTATSAPTTAIAIGSTVSGAARGPHGRRSALIIVDVQHDFLPNGNIIHMCCGLLVTVDCLMLC
jgi:hypothetical protein